MLTINLYNAQLAYGLIFVHQFYLFIFILYSLSNTVYLLNEFVYINLLWFNISNILRDT